MPFPIQTDYLSVENGPDLLARLETDANAGGGTMVDALAPHNVVARLHESGALEHGEVVGLAAALIQRGKAATACEGARIAAALEDTSLGALLLHALDGLDIGELLTMDPIKGDCSTEDTLLNCAQSIVDIDDQAQRHALLAHLRRAGLADLEFNILCKAGSPSELRLWLPAILQEIGDLTSLEGLNLALQRGEEQATALGRALAQLPIAVQTACRDAAPIPVIEEEILEEESF